MAILAQDTFAGRTVGSGWGTASDGHTWAQNNGGATVLSVGSNEGKAHGGFATTQMLLGSGTAANQEGVVRFAQGQANDQSGLVLRSDNTSANFYYAETGGFANDISINKVVAGTKTNLDVQACGFTVTPGSFYWMRFQVIGTTLKCRMWADGNAEPNTWQSSITDATFASGQYGIFVFSFGSTDAQYDSYQANDTTSAMPLITQSEAKFFIKANLQIQSRAKFLVRLKLGTTAQAKFLVRLVLKTQAQAKFFVRSLLQTQARAKFLTRLKLATNARAKFVSRLALRTITRAKFLVNQIINPLKQFKVAFVSQSKDKIAFISQSTYKLSFSEAIAMITPNSTIQSSATVTDASGNLQATLTGTVTVLFPDGTSSAPLTPANAGSGVYTLTYTTKGTGLMSELWSFVDGSGNVLTDKNTLVCTYSH